VSSKYERELKKILEQHDFFVIRSAGSKSIDLISAIPKNRKGNIVFIEEKSTHDRRFYTSNNQETKDQYDMNSFLAEEYNLDIVYAIRYVSNQKSKLWKIYEPDYESSKYPVFRDNEGIALEDWINKKLGKQEPEHACSGIGKDKGN